MEGKKIKIQRDDGTKEDFIYGGRKLDGTITILKKIRHNFGDVLELRIDNSYRVNRNVVKVPDSDSGYVYGSWHTEYEHKFSLINK